MISRVTFHRSSLIAPARRSFLGIKGSQCGYSNAVRSDPDPEQTDLLDQILNYETLAPSKPNTSNNGLSSSSSSLDKKHSKHSSQEMRDFSKLLDSLWSQSSSNKRAGQQQQTPELDKKTRRIQSSIEKQLLSLVLRKNQPHKAKSPLPRSMLGTFYRGEQQQQRDRRRRFGEENGPLFASRTTQDEANQAISAVLGCQTSHALLEHVLQLQEQQFDGGDEKLPPYYARLFTRAIEHADQTLKDPYLAISIFEQVKNRSLASYVAGCTIDMYNAMLMLRWRAWRDIHGMMNLVDEMNANGVGFDHNTRGIIQEVVTEVGGEMELGGEDRDGLVWSMEERRSANVMKALVSKWLLK